LERSYHGNDSGLITNNFTIEDIPGYSDIRLDEHKGPDGEL
jgi:hypothetical protein